MDEQHVTKLFDDLIEHIKAAAWFDEHWDIYRSGNYIHIFKNNWLDENHHGVHFETYIGEKELENGHFPVVLHAESDVPFRDSFVQRMCIVIGDRDNLEVGVNDYTILRKMIALDAATFVSDTLAVLDSMQFVVPLLDDELAA